MNEENFKQLLREMRMIRICGVVMSAILVLAALNRIFRFFP